MLQLKNITKNYETGSTTVEALKDIELKFRDNEFVSVLGPSGCGKTTLLNLLGGLDRYTTGDLIINGKSTQDFTDREWDTYRNRRIGFVFQNYNLIPHQTVFRNVELALTLSGVSKQERRKRTREVLEKVGLSDQLNKKPNQMSGGQMQRVSIARALINNPDILLADEPTGALDSETSKQIMALIQEIAKERLVIMVTHNGDLAERYSTRIIKLFDGRLVGDNNPFDAEEERIVVDKKRKKDRTAKKTSMSFMTALSLSANNLLTKKTRTFMTSFAGSIGIIGIALILSLSSGSQAYINRVSEDTLSTYPITLEERTADIGAFLSAMRDVHDENHAIYEDDGRIYSSDMVRGMMVAMIAGREDNDLKAFKKHIEKNADILGPLTNAIAYSYNSNLNIYASDHSGGIRQVNPFELFPGMGAGAGASGMGGMGMMRGNVNVWTQMIDNIPLLAAQYEILAGRWPREKHEVILLADENNKVMDYSLYSLGLKNTKDLEAMVRDLRMGKSPDGSGSETVSFSYDELLNLSFRMVLSSDLYQKSGGTWLDKQNDEEYMRDILDDALEIKIVGIIRPAENANSQSILGTIGYTYALTEYIISQVNASDIVREQKASPDTDVFTGKPFSDPNAEPEPFDMSTLSDEALAYMASLSDEEKEGLIASYSATSSATYEGNLRKLGVVDIESPNTISIYPKDFAAKEKIEEFIGDYNKANANEGSGKTIHYTDYVGLMMSSVSTVINMISSILIAFVAISLVVSSIMIGIITYVSVLERTKEIGILKSIGASKKDISRVFNAETLIIGFVAGSLGIGITVLLTIPANMIIKAVSGVSGIAALPAIGAVLLVALSMGLTLIAGLIPSKIAANKDPVVALRTE